MSISFDSIGQQCVTASADTSLVAGAVCKFSSNSAVSACADGNPIHGFVENIHGKNATVTVRGFVTAAYSGTAPNVGYCALAGAASNKVKALSGAKEYLVVHVNTAKNTVTFLL